MRWTFLAVLFAVSFCSAASANAFETNGKAWPAMPIQYYVNPLECPEIAIEGGKLSIVEFAAYATQAWGGVACADVSFQYMGTTEATWEADGMNVIYCVSNPEEWAFGAGAAGATLWIPQQNEDDPMEVDLALNAAELIWKDGGGSALESDVLDPQALITHELGHWLGMSHTPDPYATMYFATLPNAMQRTLAADDKAGLCSIYPSGYEECESDADCMGEEYCKGIQGIPVCHEPHEGPGGFCSLEYLNCDAMCWVSFYECEQICYFTSAQYEGYCSPLCGEQQPECPAGFLCTPVEEYEISICIVDPEYVPPDVGPEPALEYEEVLTQPEADEVVTFEVLPEILAADLPNIEDLPQQTEEQSPDSALEMAGEVAPADRQSGGSGCQAGLAHPIATVMLLLLLAAIWLCHRAYPSKNPPDPCSRCGRRPSPEQRRPDR